ncbi:STAS domain-containing protein [Mycobacterium parmense]|uniref:STAS domain-containing protein n=1 Tax=Mycobacterium parmense TaxID=185642 RepID=A0A7I7Z1Q9_9MYCO|nr:STAS domain-containing protein [Mycobacterium parmense]MCV7352157.1 STAS domain-containing protein [Mycobacterium parmense]ORW56145.1 sulfate transporter [Mycobacterium parmense]BBZ48125.1 STAS domain-containing protein [Mycobacterium parmense]
MSSRAQRPASLVVAKRTDESVAVLTVDGVLDAANSAALRDGIAEAALDEPAGIVVDVTALRAPVQSSWAAFIAVHWEAQAWPQIPIVLACAHRATRDAIARTGVTSFVPLYSTDQAAVKSLARPARSAVRRVAVELPADLTSLRESRRLVREWLTAWSQAALIPVALVVVNVLVENVLEHTSSFPTVRIEAGGSTATIAVSDGSNAPARRLSSPAEGIDMSGLAIVEALSRSWDSTPTSCGKTVWAVIGPENQL